ncbi:hypothetical protein HYH02_014539 [Chlamydomonas schloesseri]|uniref:GOLD domain-containing protein n=1 Tax=Chlamydomonas schloesseri TaxID=2026947 RepID=A0A835VVU5_9CHLO|nr:hypothetical protein HYH02_014539 [Chlamydomonas schloesseri]|eukprot:KAG2427708.1 hypothetical protein HYH02_014539 [Chlamydomonas schloesseri]
MGDTVEAEHFSIPGGPRIDGRVLVSGNSQYYVPFVTIRVLSPTGDQIWQQQHVYQETHFNVGARGPGSYKVCFYNPWESRTEAYVDLVYFTLAHLRRSAGTGIQIPKGTQEDRAKEVASTDHMEDVKRTILGMSEFMQVISGSQKYLHRKLERHQKTLESNRDRTLFYTGLEVGLLLLVGLVQVLAVMGFFKPGKISKVSV